MSLRGKELRADVLFNVQLLLPRVGVYRPVDAALYQRGDHVEMPCREIRLNRKKLKLLAHRESVLMVAGGQS
jgi:hypothetical protein